MSLESDSCSQGVKVVVTHSVHSSLHSVGGIQMLLPLFYQLDAEQTREADHPIGHTLLTVIANLLETSTNSQQQFLHSKGFLLISDAFIQVRDARRMSSE